MAGTFFLRRRKAPNLRAARLTLLMQYAIFRPMQILFSKNEIEEKVAQLGTEIAKTYAGEKLTVIGILKGCYMFMSDLMKFLPADVQIDFACLSSYGNSDSPQGKVKILSDIRQDIRGRHVLIVDDILDTGLSLNAYKLHLNQMEPASVKICTLVDKRCRREADIEPDFYGFRMDDGFIVGYGLDYAEKYRTIPEIYVLDPDDIGETA